jgi:proteasome accessory factor A
MWVRLHVISGDANMIREATGRKVGLVKLAIALAEIGEEPAWNIKDPVRAFQRISRDSSYKFVVDLAGSSWTTASEILESYFSAAERCLNLDPESCSLIESSRKLLEDLSVDPAAFRRKVDWAAKKFILEQYLESEGADWDDPNLRSYDLEYHNVDPEESLFAALQAMDVVDPDPPETTAVTLLNRTMEGTRARARGEAVKRFAGSIETLSWTSLVFKDGEEVLELLLPPDLEFPSELEGCESVGTFINMIRGAA